MIIDIEDIINYSQCPMIYKYSKLDKYKSNKISILTEYDKTIHESIYTYLNLMKSGAKVSLKNLLSIFGTKWIGTDKTINDMLFITPLTWRDTHNEKRKEGIKALTKLDKYLNKQEFYPILIGQQYKFQICKGLILTGRFQVIREINQSIEIIDFKTDDKTQEKLRPYKDLSITAQWFAFKENFNQNPDIALYYGLHSGTKYNAFRTDKDLKMLKTTIKNISLCIKNNIYYVCPGPQCYYCIYKDICENLNNDMLTERVINNGNSNNNL